MNPRNWKSGYLVKISLLPLMSCVSQDSLGLIFLFCQIEGLDRPKGQRRTLEYKSWGTGSLFICVFVGLFWMDSFGKFVHVRFLPWLMWQPGFPGGASGKVGKPTCQFRRHKRHRFHPRVGKIPWRRARQPTPVFLPGESHRQRNLVGYSP